MDVKRLEYKYIIPFDTSVDIQKDLQKLLQCDNNSYDGEYVVRSLYYDSYDNKDYYDKVYGNFYHKKIRLRCYGDSDETYKFELKEKRGEYQRKLSIGLKTEEAKQVQEGRFDCLIEDKEDYLKLFCDLSLGLYRPVILIEYNRRAFVYEENNTRVTFDSYIRFSDEELDIFEKNPSWKYIEANSVVMEIKYNNKLFSPISKVLKKYKAVLTSFSKYEQGRNQSVYYTYL